MKKEKLKILTLIEEGKITVEEATKLLNAMKENPVPCSNSGTKEDLEEKLNGFSRSIEALAKEVSEKIGGAYKDMEPKLKKTTRKVVEKTAQVVDEISKSLNESLKKLEDENTEQDEEECKEGCKEVEICDCAELVYNEPAKCDENCECKEEKTEN